MPGARGLHIDASFGMAGDMFLGALFDVGLELDTLEAALKGLSLPGFRLCREEVRRGALRAVRARVLVTGHDGREREEEPGEFHQSSPHHHGHGRHYRDIVELIEKASFSDVVKKRALDIFGEIGRAEARVHGTSLDAVHFHEVGAVDSIVDVCAAALGLELLGIEWVTAGTIGTGQGTKNMAHGLMPLPAPATAEIIQGLPVASCGVADEVLTPTGAAILKVIVDDFVSISSPRPMVVEGTGYGAGSRDRGDPPNIVRVQLCRHLTGVEGGEWVHVLETQVDDSTGEVLGYARQLLEEAGALDVLMQPVQMKKNRPGVLITVLALDDTVEELERLLLVSTSSFGVRRYRALRRLLERHSVTVETPLGAARIKLGRLGDDVVHATPEYEDCARLARASGLTLQQVMALVEDSFRQSGKARPPHS